MGRPDKQEKQRRRAQQGIEAAIARGRLAEAADALLALPAAARAGHAQPIAASLAVEHERLLRAHEYAQLLSWCVRVEREPGLLPGSADLARVRWCWLLAAVKTRQWARARPLLQQLEGALAGSAAFAPLSELVEHQGQPPCDVFAAFEAEAAQLGVEALGRAASYACPAAPQEVEDACVACLGVEPWPRFRAVVAEWLGRASAEVAREIRRAAIALSWRELLVRTAKGDATALEVAGFCAGLCTQLGAPSALEPSAAQGVRVAARLLVGTVADRRVVENCIAISGAALCYPQLAEAMELVILAPQYRLELVDTVELLFRPFIERRGAPNVLLRLGALLAFRAEQTETAPPLAPWLVQAFERALGDAPALARALGNDEHKNGSTGISFLLDRVPLPLCLRAIPALFDAAEEPAREALSRAADDALARIKRSAAGQRATPPLSEVRAFIAIDDPATAITMSDAELKRFLSTPDGRELAREVIASRPSHGKIPDAMRPDVERLASVLLPYNLALLDDGLARCAGKRARRGLVARYWARRPGLQARFAALLAALHTGHEHALLALAEELLLDCRPEAEDAARALLRADRVGAPKDVRRKLAQALLSCAPEAGSGRVTEALRLARRLVRGRPAKSGAAGETASKRGGKTRRKRSAQTELFETRSKAS
jgi:hypothetical protein